MPASTCLFALTVFVLLLALWRKPWDARSCGEVHLPLRADGQPFGGMNAITLLMAGAAGGYASPFWLTYAQAKRAGGQVRKGERSMPAILYKTRIVEDSDHDEDARVLRYLKCYPVFCAALPHRGGPPVLLVRRFPRSGVHAATSSQ